MQILAALAAAVLVTGGLSPVPSDLVPAGNTRTAVQTVSDFVEEPSVHVLNEPVAIEELAAAGFEVESVDEDGARLSADLDSPLGDGSVVDTSLSVDLVDGAGTATIESAALPTGNTVLSLEIHELTDDLVDVTITDASTGVSQRVTSSSGQGAAIPLVLGIPLVISALEALIVASAAVIVAGVTYVAVTKVIEAINRSGSSYQHFMAARLSGRPLMIGNGLAFGAAVTRVKAQSDVWSRTRDGARTVCSSASGGRTPLGPEVDRAGIHKVEHYHPAPRNNAHCFFGGPK